MNTLEGKRIAVIEDNVTNLAVFALTLKQQGATIFQDAWTTDSIQFLLSRLPLDVILLDIMLRQGLSGYDVFDSLQAHPELKDIPVVAVSSLDAETEIPKALSKGFAGFIGKPISLLDFPNQVAACIAGEKVWATSY